LGGESTAHARPIFHSTAGIGFRLDVGRIAWIGHDSGLRRLAAIRRSSFFIGTRCRERIVLIFHGDDLVKGIVLVRRLNPSELRLVLALVHGKDALEDTGCDRGGN